MAHRAAVRNVTTELARRPACTLQRLHILERATVEGNCYCIRPVPHQMDVQLPNIRATSSRSAAVKLQLRHIAHGSCPLEQLYMQFTPSL